MKTSTALSALILVAACQAAPSDAASLPPPPDEIAAIIPPTGPLLGVARGGRSATFLDRAGVVQIDGAMQATLLVVYRPPLETPYGAAHIGAERVAYDCARRTMTPLGAQAFDEAGQRVMWLPPGPPEPLEPGLSHDFVAQVLCDGAEPPNAQTVEGVAGAVALAETILATGRR